MSGWGCQNDERMNENKIFVSGCGCQNDDGNDERIFREWVWLSE